MKHENDNLEKNISRLVKQSVDSGQPGKNFTDSLIDNAINELTEKSGTPARERKSTIMTAKKIFAYAASILIVCGILIALMTQNKNETKRQLRSVAKNEPVKTIGTLRKTEDEAQTLTSTEKQEVTTELKAAQIEYIQTDKPAIAAQVAAAKPYQSAIEQERAKRIADLLANAQNFQNQQRYEEALAQLEMACALDSNNMKILMHKQVVADAINFRKQLVVAKDTEKGLTEKLETSSTPYSEEMTHPKNWREIAGKSSEYKAQMSGASNEPTGQKRERTTSLGVADSTLGYGVTRGKEAGCIMPYPPPCRPPVSYCPPPYKQPMAHGGTTPPNGEDVDAMFFKNYGVNPFIDTEDDHLSTFAIDVDTASYTVVRGYLHDSHLPPNDAVRVEEFVNYFKYDYPAPQNDDFAVYTEAAPWNFGEGRTNACLLRIGLKAKQISDENRKPAILTFVIDISGSMARENRLGLVKKSLRMLVEQLRPDDKIGIAVYGSRGRKVMDYKGLDEKDEILSAIEMLGSGGSTYAEEGIRIGYEMAEKAFKKNCINRVILCTDGVANVGQTGADNILKVIKEKSSKGILLSAIGFGMGNYNDVLLEQLGDKGNGHYTYIDTIAEAKRIFEDNLTGTLEVIARDVKVQVDFNPDVVRSYRLIGYENRDVPDNKFRDDKYDGGEIGAGLATTALYELKLWPGKKGNIATTYVRYKDAQKDSVTEFKSNFGTKQINHDFAGSSKQFRLAATAAEFAEILRHSYWARGTTLKPTLQQAQKLSQEFKDNTDVIELADLISKAEQLMPKPPVEIPQEED